MNTTKTISKSDVTIKREHRDMKFSIPYQITEDEALALQQELSYHPAGYGFYSFKSTPTETTWNCSDSCD